MQMKTYALAFVLFVILGGRRSRRLGYCLGLWEEQRAKLEEERLAGSLWNPGAMTAAHRTLQFGTRMKITNRKRQSKHRRAHLGSRGLCTGPSD